MGRKPIVTADGVVEAIQQSPRPFASTGDLAEHFDVTRQAVRGKRDRLESDGRIEVGRVSNVTVFYLNAKFRTDENAPSVKGAAMENSNTMTLQLSERAQELLDSIGEESEPYHEKLLRLMERMEQESKQSECNTIEERVRQIVNEEMSNNKNVDLNQDRGG